MEHILRFISFLSPMEFIIAGVFGLVLLFIFGAVSGRPILFLVLGMLAWTVSFAAVAYVFSLYGVPVQPIYVLWASLVWTFVAVVFFRVKVLD